MNNYLTKLEIGLEILKQESEALKQEKARLEIELETTQQKNKTLEQENIRLAAELEKEIEEAGWRGSGR